MTHDPVAIVAPSIDRSAIVRACLDLKKKIGDAEQKIAILPQWRQAMGVQLVDLRKSFSKRGDGFVEFVEKEIGLPARTALDYMQAVGYQPRGPYQTNAESALNDPPAPAEPAPRAEPAPASKAEPPTRATKTDQAPRAAAKADDEDKALGAVSTVALTSVAGDAPPAWVADLQRLVEDMRRHISAAFSRAEQIDAICAEHEATVASPALLTSRSMVVAIKTTADRVLKTMEGSK